MLLGEARALLAVEGGRGLESGENRLPAHTFFSSDPSPLPPCRRPRSLRRSTEHATPLSVSSGQLHKRVHLADTFMRSVCLDVSWIVCHAQGQVVAACGAMSDGSVRVIRNGIGINEQVMAVSAVCCELRHPRICALKCSLGEGAG